MKKIKSFSYLYLIFFVIIIIISIFPHFYEKAKEIRRAFIKNSKNSFELKLALGVKKKLTFDNNEKVLKRNNNFYLEDGSKDYSAKYSKKTNILQNHKKFSKDLFVKDFEIEIPGRQGMIQAKPQMCGGYLYFASKYGYLGKVDLELKKILWFKKIENSFVFANKNFVCKFVSKLKKEIIFVPSEKGIFCIQAKNGTLEKKICKNGIIPSKKSLVEPVFFKNNIYIATSTPSGVESYNYLNGKFLWRVDLEQKPLGGSNPWSGIIFDEYYRNIIINTGSPTYWPGYNPDKNYKYANSTIAIDAYTGKINWYFQEHKKDFWDHDLVGTPILLKEKIDNKHIVVTLSKSGNIFFIDRKNGKVISDIKNSSFNFDKLNFNILTSNKPSKLLNNDFYQSDKYQYTDVIYKDKKGNREQNQLYYGLFPPILKKTRVFDGYSGGPQWFGGSYSQKNKMIIIPYNKNQIVKHFYDFQPKENFNKYQQNLFVSKNCLSCHEKGGKVINKKNYIIPSLFLISKIYKKNQFKDFFKNDYIHNQLNLNKVDIESLYDDLDVIDNEILRFGKYEKYEKFEFLNFFNDDNIKKLKSFGYIAAISSENFETKWIIPAGAYFSSNNKKVSGSPNWGGVVVYENLVIFNGSYDKMIYAFDIFNGKKIWEQNLPASASSPPQIFIKNNDLYLVITATGGRVDKGNKIVVFKKNS